MIKRAGYGRVRGKQNERVGKGEEHSRKSNRNRERRRRSKE